MPLTHNAARGEVPLTVGGVDLVIAAEMGGLAQLSAELRCDSFLELMRRISGQEVATMYAAVRILPVKGDPIAAAAAMTVSDLPAVQAAVSTALLHHSKGTSPGKGRAARKRASPGGDGRKSPSEI
jgi:hypothetical protein